ncbi:MAG: LptF/LptG family permease [Candidatus Brocadiae bacterium]|nr:LptF/LptG family permease [Candidatus Brocadiia bacterium]
MVRILHRYVLHELARSFLLAFFALMIIMMLGGIYKPLSMGFSLSQLLRFMPYLLPYALPWVIPAALLTATLMTYGRLSADNELMATEASGLPIRYMCYPAIVASLAVVACGLPMNSQFIPYCRTMQKRVIADAIAERPFAIGTLGSEETIKMGDFRLFVASIEDDVLHKVLVIAPMEDPAEEPEDSGKKRAAATTPKPARRVQVYRADEAHYSVDKEKHVIRIALKDARYTIVTPNESASGWLDLKAEEQTITIPIATGSGHLRTARSELYSHELETEAAALQELLASGTVPERRVPDTIKRRCSLLTEIHRREALAFSSFVLCLLGVPLGILIRRESKLASFSVAVLVFLALYSLLVGGEALAMQQVLSPRVALWGPDIIMGTLGLGFLLHTFRR